MPAAILIYHRVAEVETDSQLLCVSPRHFDQHLQVLRRHCQPVALMALVDGLRAGRVPDRAVAVTFDDGYADNLAAAKPILERHDVPATVFVVSGDDPPAGEFWWDELERVLLQPGILPRSLRLTLGRRVKNAPHVRVPLGARVAPVFNRCDQAPADRAALAHSAANDQTLEWELGGSAVCRADQWQHERAWDVTKPCEPGSRHALYRTLHDRLRALTPELRRQALDGLLAWAGAESRTRPSHRRLSPDEIARLDEGGLVEVGAHTARHPVLAALPTADQWAEIDSSRRSLESILRRPVRAFSYPYGQRSDYAPETVDLVRRAGFTAACANFAGLVGPTSDPYQLPRLGVRDWDGDGFARRLDEAWTRV